MSRPNAIADVAIPGLLKALVSPWGSRVDLVVTPWESGDDIRPDYKVLIRWQGRSYEFAAECKSRSTPQVIELAVQQARRAAKGAGLLPMIIVPYLDERRLDRLAEEGVSGLDLSGNGIVIVPGRLLLRRSGQPNRFRESQPARYVYRGATSLVPRVFLCRREYPSVGAIKDEIERRGGSVALSTVSKALARMVEDVVIERSESGIALLQPEELLEKLRLSFAMPVRRRAIRVKATEPIARFFRRANGDRERPRLVLSGASSQDRYAAGIRSDEIVAYCQSIGDIRLVVGQWEESERFADLTIAEIADQTPFFDTRKDTGGIAYASPVQTFLELSGGDKRDREMANEIRDSILRDLK